MKTINQILKTVNVMLRKFLCGMILIADNQPTFIEKIKYFITILCTLSPIAYCLGGMSFWFSNNKQFATFVLLAIIINVVVGGVFHWRNKTFTQEQFLVKNGIMIAVLIISYTLLEMLHLTIGDNIFSDSFRTLIQISTLLYPISKTFKNLYILSNKQFPPDWMMERLYNFEKTGNIDTIVKGIKINGTKDKEKEKEVEV
jgi:hypothetical protein